MGKVSLNRLVRSSEARLLRLAPAHIEIEIRLHPSLGEVDGDAELLQRAFLSLATDALGSMQDGGRLIVETANIVVDDGPGLGHGPYAMLSVRSTAATAGGSAWPGLELATEAVQRCGGIVRVFHSQDQGATVKLCLPRCSAVSSSSPPTPSPVTAPTGTETVLVVDDERIVLRMVCRILSAQGYRILSAGSGAEALELQARHAGPIHMLLTDVVMPNMNGLELRDQLRQLRPQIKTLFVSGCVDLPDGTPLELDRTSGFLQKPFSLWDLITKVDEILRS